MPLGDAAGRVLAAEIRAAEPVPPFDRAAMDGFALRGEETFGADAYTPAHFRVIGQSRPGRRFGGNVGPGEAVEIATGAPLPLFADTVVPVEICSVQGDLVRVVEATPPGRHVSRRGEDIEAGALVLAQRRILRPRTWVRSVPWACRSLPSSAGRRWPFSSRATSCCRREPRRVVTRLPT